jgi:hypothetical protein
MWHLNKHIYILQIIGNERCKYDVIVDLLSTNHHICISVHTLKRRLQVYGLKKRSNVVDLIKQEAEGSSGNLKGYRAIWHALRIKHHVHVPRSLVATYQKEIDPDASRARRNRRPHRRQYVSHIVSKLLLAH